MRTSQRFRWVFALAGLLLVSLLLSACGAETTPEVIKETVIVETEKTVKETVVVETERVVKETVVVEQEKQVEVVVTPTPLPEGPFRVVVGLDTEPNTFDPHLTTGRASESFMSNVFDGLTLHDQEGKLIPGLATSWETLDDLTWEFKLREGVVFHNGEPFNADSVKFTLDRVLEPERNATIRPLLENITEVEIVDDYTVIIRIAEPDLMLPARIAELYGSMMPPQYVQENGDEYIALNPIGTGPYIFKEWVKDDHITLVANDNYWGDPPSVQEIQFRIIKDNGTRVAALLSGEVDIINGVPIAQESVVRSYPGVKSVPVSVPRIYYVSLDVRKPPFDDVRVRQAVNYAIDRQAIVDSLFAGFGVPAAVNYPRASWGFNPDLEPYPYDPEKAKELLAEAGYPNGFDTEFDTFVGRLPAHDTIAQAVVSQLADVGINAKVNAFEFGVFSERRIGDQHAPMFIYSIGDWALEPVWMFGWLTQGQAGHYWSPPEWEDLLSELSRTYDPQARIPLYHQVQDMLYEYCPFASVAELETIWGVREGIEFQPRPDETLKFAAIYKSD
jgi:peptide/nickel transport system substrate-binding protein